MGKIKQYNKEMSAIILNIIFLILIVDLLIIKEYWWALACLLILIIINIKYRELENNSNHLHYIIV